MAEEQKKEEQKVLEANRDFALKMMKDDHLKNLASVYLIEKGGFGEEVKTSAERELYSKSLSEGMRYIDPNEIVNSRDEGQRYTGSISEKKILEGNLKTMQANLTYMKVNDVLEDMGAKKDKNMRDKYVQELDKESLQGVISLYQNNLVYNKISESMKSTSDNIIRTIDENGLEKMLKGGKE